VDVFFVISGYLITSIILKGCNAGEFSLLRFYQRRIARIFPAFFTVALATMLGAWFIYTPQDLPFAGTALVAATLSVANMKFMLWGNYFTIVPDAQPFLHYWSLSVEEQFYMIYPLLFLLLFKYARKHKPLVFWLVGLASLTLCIVLTHYKPVWAFYLLPTRAWELIAGCLLAIWAGDAKIPERIKPILPVLSTAGLGLIIVSFFVIHEGPHFPGAWPVLPVLGSVAVMLPQCMLPGFSERLLSSSPLVMIGKMSYSLYLWHWPIYSLVDYKMIFASEAVRFSAKIGLSLGASYLSLRLIESPARKFLNERKNRPIAFAGLAVAIAICVSLGVFTRNTNYINAVASDVAKGGLVFPGQPGKPTVVLMGDSNGSMYGKVLKSICAELGYKLTVISVGGSDTLPFSNGQQNQLWTDALAVVKQEKPDFIVLACLWGERLDNATDRLETVLSAVRPYAKQIVILNEPPVLPKIASREQIRAGARPPFFEDQQARQIRVTANAFIAGLKSNHVRIVDIAPSFEGSNGEALYLDKEGNQLYYDPTHLSDFGTKRIRRQLTAALKP